MPQGTEVAESYETNFRKVHDAGAYFRLSAGVSFASSFIEPPLVGEASSQKGVRLAHQLVLGGYLTERVALGVHQWGVLGAERGLLSSGLGLTLYVDESDNWFVSGALGAQTLYDGAPDLELFEQWGASGLLEVGTGWWVANNWSMGLSFLGGASGFDLDGDGIAGGGWHVGLAITLSAN